MSFGVRLKLLREEKLLSRENLAILLNLSYSTISKYETDIRFPDQEVLKKIAKYFDVSLDYLMGISNIRNPYIEKKAFTKTDKYLEQLKVIAEEKGIEFDETSAEDLMELYTFLKNRKKSN